MFGTDEFSCIYGEIQIVSSDLQHCGWNRVRDQITNEVTRDQYEEVASMTVPGIGDITRSAGEQE